MASVELQRHRKKKGVLGYRLDLWKEGTRQRKPQVSITRGTAENMKFQDAKRAFETLRHVL